MASDAKVTILSVAESGSGKWRAKAGEIEGPLRDKLGEGMEIEFRRVGALTKLSNGKTPIVIGASSS